MSEYEGRVPKCSGCGRERTISDDYDFNPLQIITGRPLGWYSGDDGEICPACMADVVGRMRPVKRSCQLHRWDTIRHEETEAIEGWRCVDCGEVRR